MFELLIVIGDGNCTRYFSVATIIHYDQKTLTEERVYVDLGFQRGKYQSWWVKVMAGILSGAVG